MRSDFNWKFSDEPELSNDEDEAQEVKVIKASSEQVIQDRILGI